MKKEDTNMIVGDKELMATAHVHGHAQPCNCKQDISDRLYDFLNLSENDRGYIVDDNLRNLTIDAYLEIMKLRVEVDSLKEQLRDTRWALTNARDEVNRLSDYERN